MAASQASSNTSEMLSSKLQSLKLETPDSTKDCMTEAGIDVEAFVGKMLRLLRLEREAEVEACLSKEGESTGGLSSMILKDIEPGALGRSVLTFAPKAAHLAHKLPVHSLSPNAPAAVRATAQKGEAGTEEIGTIATGIVTRVGPGSISLSMDEVPAEGLDLVVSLEPVPNEAAHNRMAAAIQSLPSVVSSGSSVGAEVARLCMYQLPLAPATPVTRAGFPAASCSARAPAAAPLAPEALEWSPISSSHLDGSQAEAVSLALGRPDLALVHGPPGTGKTTTLVEIIAQHALRGHKVLACAASNVAVDNLVERLAAVRLPGARRSLGVVRLGHPARLAPSILGHSLEAKLGEPLHAQSVRACLKEQQKLTQKLAKCTSRAQRAERASLRSQLRGLSSEQRALQWLAVRDIVAAADVVCATLTGVDVSALRDVRFELVALDEAGQAVEPACWPALLRGRKTVLAGDHRQLPPTVLSPAAEKGGLGCTLFERLMKRYPQAGVMLNVQYRMHAAIMDWSSRTLYDGRLRAHESCQSRNLALILASPGAEACTRGREVEASSAAADPKPDKAKRKPEKKSRGSAGAARAAKIAAASLAMPLLNLASCPCLSPSTTLLLIDTAGCKMDESATTEQGSKSNALEAEVAMTHVRRLHALGLGLDQIGVISPYAAQVSLLRDLRRAIFGEQAALEVSTVDGFQGREKEAIVISAVRSNGHGAVGFLNDARRMNVAVTRARCHCALVGDSETLKTDPFLDKLVEYFEQEGDQESACLLVDA